MMRKTTHSATLAFILVLVTSSLHAQDSSGGPVSRLIGRFRQHHSPAASIGQSATSVCPQANTVSGSSQGRSDPYGFTAILNRFRAASGLSPVVYDADLSTWAGRNNLVQCVRGLGHHVNPCGVQNCGWNYSDATSVAQGWMNSAGHRQNMLSPEITRVGIAFGPGPYWTLNAK